MLPLPLTAAALEPDPNCGVVEWLLRPLVAFAGFYSLLALRRSTSGAWLSDLRRRAAVTHGNLSDTRWLGVCVCAAAERLLTSLL